MTNDTLTIQLVDDTNREAVVALTVASDQARFIETNTESLREMETDLKYAWECYALCRDAHPVGFMMIGAENKEERYVWIDRFMIDVTEQGKGIGSTCLQLAIQWMQERFDVDDIVLSLHPTNEPAKRFYAKVGFVDSGLIDEWNGEEIWVYHVKQGQPS
ncbi:MULTISPECIES: GNAT family N-acetyltransferase [Exiguobacterium]|uniref:GNAT family N-acetyltransferase n=1 Tax=Exiguobacterium TaxID=33986 RepID=UPI001BECEFA6|nr:MULTISPECIES: GNAT family N-acetyltransferase [Exiguobacterium]MCT4777687.1 GNAT family N-acetyltransferase [Exiguobacterium aquaticum]MCT4790002.1 GNAT family N-acetyltransferase [Exiguobacterium mexicanum]